jgi:hypothetical protein
MNSANDEAVSCFVTAVEGQGQTGTLGTQPRGRTKCLDVTGGRVGCCDHGSEQESKGLVEVTKQGTRAGKLGAQ